MGILPIENSRRAYVHELEFHSSRRETELPIEKLDAVFIETAGGHPKEAKELAEGLHYLHGLTKSKKHKGSMNRVIDIIKRAANSRTEIWFGDVKSTKSEKAISTAEIALSSLARAGVIAATINLPAAIVSPLASPHLIATMWLARKGNAKNRKISRSIAEKMGLINPRIQIRNLTMAHKIKALAEKTGHKNIGLLTGAAHVGIASLLEKDAALTVEQRAKIAKRSPDALKMYRCIYDKQTGRWRVEEHSL
ncbi:MAG: hypothetical protein Q8R15_02405 [Candidatus Micrarchaeota archaeon]|nr:hypothetical protein [Candidatus Micrarchaeota archaeon]